MLSIQKGSNCAGARSRFATFTTSSDQGQQSASAKRLWKGCDVRGTQTGLPHNWTTPCFPFLEADLCFPETLVSDKKYKQNVYRHMASTEQNCN